MSTIPYTRLGSATSYETALANISNQQASIAQLQGELSSGKRVVNPSDDPTAAAAAERAQTRIDRISADQRALQAQQSAITTAESTLGDITTALQSFRSLVVSAGNASLTPSDLKAIQVQLSGIRDHIFSLGNQQDTNGRPLFAALGSALAPFVAPNNPAQGYTFKGLPGQNASSFVSIPFALDGNAAFMNTPQIDGVYNVMVANGGNPIPSGRSLTTTPVTVTNSALVNGDAYSLAVTNVDSTTTPGTTVVSYSVTDTTTGTAVAGSPFTAPGYPTTQSANIVVQGLPGLSLNITGQPAVGDTVTVTAQNSLFSTLDNAISNIGGAPNQNAQTQAVAQALNNIDIGLSKVSAVRGQAGDLLNRADTITNSQNSRTQQLNTDMNNAQNLDMVKGMSDFQNQQTAYQAALQSYAAIKKLNLFSFLS